MDDVVVVAVVDVVVFVVGGHAQQAFDYIWRVKISQKHEPTQYALAPFRRV